MPSFCRASDHQLATRPLQCSPDSKIRYTPDGTSAWVQVSSRLGRVHRPRRAVPRRRHRRAPMESDGPLPAVRAWRPRCGSRGAIPAASPATSSRPIGWWVPRDGRLWRSLPVLWYNPLLVSSRHKTTRPTSSAKGDCTRPYHPTYHPKPDPFRSVRHRQSRQGQPFDSLRGGITIGTSTAAVHEEAT